MQLIVGREDLHPEYQKHPCSYIRFEHFTKEIQQIIKLTKSAIFYEWDRSNYNAIYSPKQTQEAIND